MHKVEFDLDGQSISLETGRLAKQADGSVLVRCGDNMVLTTVVSSKKETDLDFFPLTVEYSEKFYSSGKIPGGYFKREGRPSGDAILNCRLLDRPIRPLFPKGYNFETQIVATILSCDALYPMHSLAAIGASAALQLSDIPFAGPMCLLEVEKQPDGFKFNPSAQPALNGFEKKLPPKKPILKLAVAGTSKGILMVEGEAQFASNEDVLEALKITHNKMSVVFDAQAELCSKAGAKTKRTLPEKTQNTSLQEQVRTKFADPMRKSLTINDKQQRSLQASEVKQQALQDIALPDTASADEQAKHSSQLKEALDDLKYTTGRSLVLEGTRFDARALDEVRPIACETALLPRAHGSALFTRGETQVLGTVTLGTPEDEQKVDTLGGLVLKKFMLHYNFPPYCVGETGRMGGQSRREIGHGNLAQRALQAVLPEYEKFPYTIRLVSEVLESNGSSSMGTVCSGAMALLDAGVPLKDNVAGVAMGLISSGDKVAVLTDILGDEDHLGDMDFKVAGSRRGITALQMDIKIDSLSFDVLKQALEQARRGVLHILDKMEERISTPRKELSPYAPRIHTLRVKPEKIKTIIGVGGKTVKSIVEQTGVRISLEDDGQVHIASTNPAATQRAIALVNAICAEAEVGQTYTGTVTKVVEFGAFVQVLPNTSGLLHISEIAHERIRRVSDYLKEGDEVEVKVTDVDRTGRIKLSRKALLDAPH